MAIMYGHDVAPKNDPFVTLAEDANRAGSEAVLPGFFAVNTFPFLQHLPTWMPGTGFWPTVYAVRKMVEDMKTVPFDFVRKNMVISFEVCKRRTKNHAKCVPHRLPVLASLQCSLHSLKRATPLVGPRIKRRCSKR